jgi:diguanylate cyclase (GGDEF)-like protein
VGQRRYGHITGDEVLAAVGRDVAASVRPFDVACRIGGEEFAVILPQTTKAEGMRVAERIRSRVAQNVHEGLPPVTISCGVATYPDDASTMRALTKRADDAMYAAKAAGRDVVHAWTD